MSPSSRLSRRSLLIAGAGTAGGIAAGGGWYLWSRRTVPTHSFEVVAAHPHDPQAFTQGLCYHDGFLYESTGQRGQSSLRRVEIDSGQVLQQIKLADRYFGEGIAIFDDEIFQLTWESQVAFVYDLGTLEKRREISYVGEGWGLVRHGDHLLMSNGGSYIDRLQPESFERVDSLKVEHGGRNVDHLNELEIVDGRLWANVWGRDVIAQIDPESGELLGWVDLSGLLSIAERGGKEHVLNGIAHDPQTGRTWVTGKNWPQLFEIRVT